MPLFPIFLAVPAALVACLFHISNLLVFSPYFRKGDDRLVCLHSSLFLSAHLMEKNHRLHLGTISVITLILLAGHMFENDEALSSSPASDKGMSAILILLIIEVLVFFALQNYQLAKRLWKEYRTKRVKEEARTEGAPPAADFQQDGTSFPPCVFGDVRR